VSLFGQVGSERAAEEIAAFVRKRLDGLGAEAVSCPERGKAEQELQAVLAFAEEIRQAAKTGWY
jgi:hypothetical protein